MVPFSWSCHARLVMRLAVAATASSHLRASNWSMGGGKAWQRIVEGTSSVNMPVGPGEGTVVFNGGTHARPPV